MTKSPANEWDDKLKIIIESEKSKAFQAGRLSLLSELEEGVKGMKKEITDGMFNAAINSGRGTGSIGEVHYNDAITDVLSLINNLKKREGK